MEYIYTMNKLFGISSLPKIYIPALISCKQLMLWKGYDFNKSFGRK